MRRATLEGPKLTACSSVFGIPKQKKNAPAFGIQQLIHLYLGVQKGVFMGVQNKSSGERTPKKAIEARKISSQIVIES